MNRKSVWLILTFFAFCALALAQAGPVQIVTDVPFDQQIADPCTGELVAYTGAVHTVTTTIVDGDGTVHSIMNANYQNVTGVGLTSGNQYRFVNVATSSSLNSQPRPFPQELTFTFKLVVTAPGPTLESAVTVFHATVNANAQISSEYISEFAINCTQ